MDLALPKIIILVLHYSPWQHVRRLHCMTDQVNSSSPARRFGVTCHSSKGTKNTLESSICLQNLNRLQLSYALGHTGRITTGEDM